MKAHLPRRIAALLVLGFSLLSCGMTGGSSAASPELQPVTVNAEFLRHLEGSYTMKTLSDGKTRYSTATVKSVAVGQYQISRVTVYGPVLYGFQVSEDGSIRSEELGNGQVSYKESIDKTTIRFEREDSICELTR